MSPFPGGYLTQHEADDRQSAPIALPVRYHLTEPAIVIDGRTLGAGWLLITEDEYAALASRSSQDEKISELKAENLRLRAALALSDQPCAYCSLSASEWARCQHGFPGCDRADDAMGCPELGARLRADDLEASLKRMREALESALAMLRHTHDRLLSHYPELDMLCVSLVAECRVITAALSADPATPRDGGT